MSLTACILTRDEEVRIAGAIAGVGFADHVLVVDACSTDRTVAIAREAGAESHVHPQRDFASQRDFALSLVRTEWVLWVDADWVVPPAFAAEVLSAIRAADIAGYEIPLVNRFCGRILHHGGLHPEYRLRLHRVRGARWTGAVHEQVEVPGAVGRLGTAIEHEFAGELDVRARKTIGYARALAEQMRANGYRFRRRDLFWYPARRTLGKLLVRGGLLDGIAGVIFWSLRGLESFLALALVWAAEREARTSEVPA